MTLPHALNSLVKELNSEPATSRWLKCSGSP